MGKSFIGLFVTSERTISAKRSVICYKINFIPLNVLSKKVKNAGNYAMMIALNYD
jgi:hypothetical protein